MQHNKVHLRHYGLSMKFEIQHIINVEVNADEE